MLRSRKGRSAKALLDITKSRAQCVTGGGIALPLTAATCVGELPRHASNILFAMRSTAENDVVLRFLRDSLTRALGNRVRQVLLFGSRARGDATPDSDYDLLVVMDKVDQDVVREIDDMAGRALLDYGVVVSAFPIAEEDRARRRYGPLLINVAREGVAV